MSTDSDTTTKTRSEKALLVFIAVASILVLLVVGVSGFALSWETITDQAAKYIDDKFGGITVYGITFAKDWRYANLFTLCVDGVIIVLGLIRIGNAMTGRTMSMVTIGQFLLIAVSLYINFTAGTDFTSGFFHVVPAALYVFVMEVVTSILLNKYEKVKEKEKKERIFTVYQWTLSPVRISSMWRNMRRWKLDTFKDVRQFETIAIKINAELSKQERKISSVERFVLFSEITDHVNDCQTGIGIDECCTLHSSLHDLLHTGGATNCATTRATFAALPTINVATTDPSPATLQSDTTTTRATNSGTRSRRTPATSKKPSHSVVTVEMVAEELSRRQASKDDRGIQQALADHFGVDKSTISRRLSKANGSLQNVNGG